MRKDAHTYPVSLPRVGGRRAELIQRSRPKPLARSRWAMLGVVFALFGMISLTLNYRAFSELTREVEQRSLLESRIEAVTADNLDLQEEIHYLKNDVSTIEREAKKFGFARPKENVPALSNK